MTSSHDCFHSEPIVAGAVIGEQYQWQAVVRAAHPRERSGDLCCALHMATNTSSRRRSVRRVSWRPILSAAAAGGEAPDFRVGEAACLGKRAFLHAVSPPCSRRVASCEIAQSRCPVGGGSIHKSRSPDAHRLWTTGLPDPGDSASEALAPTDASPVLQSGHSLWNSRIFRTPERLR
jgi:hypothetical protein